MIVVYRQSQNLKDAMSFFGTSYSTELPFVDSTLGNVSVSGWRALLNITKFYIPKDWTHLDDGSGSFVLYDNITDILLDKELVVFTELGFLPLETIDPKDMVQGEVFTNGGISMGYGFNTMKDFLLCKEIKHTDAISYIEYELGTLVDTILASSGSHKEIIGTTPVYSGVAYVDEETEVTGSSRIYGPCIIVNSALHNATVYPGTVIINSRVSNSTVETSYIDNSGITSSFIEGSVAYSALLDNIKAVGSVFPRLTKINGKV